MQSNTEIADDIRQKIHEYEGRITRLVSENTFLRDQIQHLVKQVNQLRLVRRKHGEH